MLPQKSWHQSNHKKTFDKPKMKGMLQNIGPLAFKSVNIMKDKEKAKKLSQIGGGMMTKCNVIFWTRH